MSSQLKVKTTRKAFLINYFAMFLVLFYLYLLNFQIKIDPTLNLLLAPLSLLLISHPEWLIFYYTYIIDRDRVIEETGFLSKKRLTVPVTSIGHVYMKKPFLGRILNYGDVDVVAFGEFKMKMTGINNPDVVVGRVEEMMKKVGHSEDVKHQKRFNN